MNSQIMENSNPNLQLQTQQRLSTPVYKCWCRRNQPSHVSPKVTNHTCSLSWRLICLIIHQHFCSSSSCFSQLTMTICCCCGCCCL